MATTAVEPAPLPPPADAMAMASAPSRTASSSDPTAPRPRMTCTTCHKPHQVTGDVSKKCQCCHAAAHHAEENCATCHMPKRRTDDAVHVIMTDHRIQRLKPSTSPQEKAAQAAGSAAKGPTATPISAR